MSSQPRCQDQACALQSCLGRNTYAPAKCDEYVRKLYTCCVEMYKMEGGEAASSACPGKEAVERWLKRYGVNRGWGDVSVVAIRRGWTAPPRSLNGVRATRMVVIVTVTRPGVTVTVSPTGTVASNNSVSAGTIAGIVIGTLAGGVSLIALVWYLLNRYSRHRFSPLANPGQELGPADEEVEVRLAKSDSRGKRRYSLPRPSVSSEPLIPPESWPPLSPPLSQSQSPLSRTSSPPAMIATPLRDGLVVPSPSLAPNLFIHRMLQSRAKAEEEMGEGEEETASTESSYSQLSAPADHAAVLMDLQLARRKSSRRYSAAGVGAELAPVAEIPDTSGRVEPMALLTSVNFGGKTGTPPGSMLSTTGSSNGRTSRYPSLAASSSLSGSVQEEWQHAPSGLAGLARLRVGTLEGAREEAPRGRAHLRAGTVGSVASVERRSVAVVEGGMARIDVAM